MKQATALEMVLNERLRQDAKWGAHRRLDAGTWLTILVEEVGEVAKAVLEHDDLNFEEEVVQVAAVALAIAEAIRDQRLSVSREAV